VETGNGVSAGVLISLGGAAVMLMGWLGVIDLPWNVVWPVVLLYAGVRMIRWVTSPTAARSPDAR